MRFLNLTHRQVIETMSVTIKGILAAGLAVACMSVLVATSVAIVIIALGISFVVTVIAVLIAVSANKI